MIALSTKYNVKNLIQLVSGSSVTKPLSFAPLTAPHCGQSCSLRARSNHGLLSRLFRLPLTLFQGEITRKYRRGLEKIAKICGTNKNVFNDALVDFAFEECG